MNVLSYIHIHRLPNPSGVGRVIDQLLTSHAERFPGTRHRMLVDKKLYDKVYGQLGKNWRMASFIPHTESTSFQQAKWIWRNDPVAEKYWSDVDIVYCPAESYVPTDQAKLVCTIHDVAGFEEGLYPNDRHKKWHCLKWQILFKKMAKHADAVVTVSNFSASRIAHFFPALEPKLHVVYNAPHSMFGSHSTEAIKQEVDVLSGGHPFVFVPGGLSLRKNADLIIKALPRFMADLPEVKLIIAGTCGTAYRKQLEAIVPDNLVLPGYVSDELLNALYQQAAVVWFPSRYEGFGMPVIEAMAAGAPVVASSAASIPEVVGNAAVLCDMDDPMEHVDAIHSLVDSGQVRREMCDRGSAQSSRFTWASSAQQLEDLFQSL